MTPTHILAYRLNCRAVPGLQTTVLTELKVGDPITIIDGLTAHTRDIVNGKVVEYDWIAGKLATLQLGWIATAIDGVPTYGDAPPPPPPPIIVPGTWKLPFPTTWRGIHTSAGGWAPTTAQLNLVQQNGIKVAFIAAYERGQAQAAIPALGRAGVSQFILRACTSQPVGTPAEFATATLPVLQEYARMLPGEVMIQVHNEPNIKQEGWTRQWQNGAEFAAWFNTVARLYRAAIPNVRLGFPALSPGGDVPGVREDSSRFIHETAQVKIEADWVALHAYWQKPDGSDLAVGQPDSALPVVATEVGPADGTTVTAEAVRRAYALFATAGIPCMAWVLDGAGAWHNAAWDEHGIVV